MNIEAFRAYCLSKPGTEEALPFGPETLVFKVMGKMYALTGLEDEDFCVNLKCEPQRALALREAHDGLIIPGYHMNKKHWNTVYFESGLPEKLLLQLLDHSYDLVVASLKKTDREALNSIR